MPEQSRVAFISYSHDSEAHIRWVELFAESLKHTGFTIVLDRWNLRFGQIIYHFMESAINEADLVFVICTPGYVLKSNSRTGGVGYESMIISSEISRSLQSPKFIPVVRAKESKFEPLPAFLGNRLYADLSKLDERGEDFDRLIKQTTLFCQRPEEVEQMSSFSGMRVQAEGPYFHANSTESLTGFLQLLQNNVVGPLMIQKEDLDELFEDRGFWYASATSEASSPNYIRLVEHALLMSQVPEANQASIFRSVCISISGPENRITIADSKSVVNRFRSIAASDAHVIFVTSYRAHGACIAYAFA